MAHINRKIDKTLQQWGENKNSLPSWKDTGGLYGQTLIKM